MSTNDVELYIPKFENNVFVDHIPNIKQGLRCDCHARKHKIYTCKNFSKHLNTKTHLRWIKNLNNLKKMEYIEMLKIKEQNLRLKEIVLNLTVELETEKMINSVEVEELIEFIKNEFSKTFKSDK